MNKTLCLEIIKHIFANFGVVPANFINHDNLVSLINKEYLLSETISLDDDNGGVVKKKIWGCQLSASSQELKVILCDLSLDSNIREYYMIIQLKNSPSYGLFYSYDLNDLMEDYGTISFSLDGEKWIECETYLQATFLAGMQQVKDIGFAWGKCSDYKNQYKNMINFIKYYSTMYEELDEGQED